MGIPEGRGAENSDVLRAAQEDLKVVVIARFGVRLKFDGTQYTDSGFDRGPDVVLKAWIIAICYKGIEGSDAIAEFESDRAGG